MAKLSKDAVGFEHPARGLNHCGECVHFEKGARNSCEIVAGHITAPDWCQRFQRKGRLLDHAKGGY